MARRYRKSRRESRGRRPQIVDGDGALAGRVAVELPVSLAEVINGVSEEIERLAGAAGLLIMGEVMAAEVTSLAGPRGKHDSGRDLFRWGHQTGYAVLGGASGARELKAVLSRLEPRQQALMFGHALPMPVVIRTRDYDEALYAEMTVPGAGAPAGRDKRDLFG